MSIAIERLKRAIADLPKGGMQTGDYKVKLKLADAQRAIAELEGLKAERDALALQLETAQEDARQQRDMKAKAREQRDALAAQVTDLEFQRVCAVTQATNMFDALRLAIAAFDKYEMSVDDYPSIEHVRMRERLYSAAFLNADKHLAEIRAEAGRAGFIAGTKLLMGDRETNADEYAAKVRQGGAE